MRGELFSKFVMNCWSQFLSCILTIASVDENQIDAGQVKGVPLPLKHGLPLFFKIQTELLSCFAFSLQEMEKKKNTAVGKF